MDPSPEFPTQEIHAPVTELGPVSAQECNSESPPWGGIDLLIAACAFAAALFVASTILVSIVAHTTGVSSLQLAKSPDAMLVVPAMIAAYVALFATLYSRVAGSQGRGFWSAICWGWPIGNRWLIFPAIGFALAIVLPLLSHLLPFPKSIPMDRLFRDSRAAYLMMFMGVAIAPFTEEILFRGFLYPVLERWLKKTLMLRRQLLKGSIWVLLTVGWGYTVRRIAFSNRLTPQTVHVIPVLVAILGFFIILLWSFARLLKTKPVSPILLPGLALCTWGLVSRSVSHGSFAVISVVLLGLVLLLGFLAGAGALRTGPASRLGTVLAVLATSGLFAMVHSEQLGGAWGPLLIIFIVGLVLTITRVVTGSVATGFLIHAGYNFALFCTVYLGTDHFRHLERMNR